jgi:Domain of unknown function (DUF3806)
MKQKIDTPTEKEQAWIAEQLENATKFVSIFSPEDAKQSLTLAALDRAFSQRIASGPADNAAEANRIINCVGIAFGRFLVEGLGLEWVIATDEHGSDLAVYGLPGTGDVLVYPANFIAKRWERREADFLEQSYGWVEQQLESFRRRWSGASIIP